MGICDAEGSEPAPLLAIVGVGLTHKLIVNPAHGPTPRVSMYGRNPPVHDYLRLDLWLGVAQS